MQPRLRQNNLLTPEISRQILPVQLSVFSTERIISCSAQHKPPAFLGERYPVAFPLKQSEGYEVSALLLTFCEYTEDEKSRQRVRKLSAGRKASLVNAESTESPGWSYMLFVAKSEEEGVVNKLPQHNYAISEPARKEQVVQFFIQFHEEGQKQFELILRCTARKVLRDGTMSPEFTMESKLQFGIEVLPPFMIACEWITPEPCANWANARFYFNGENRTVVGRGKKALLGVRISTGSHSEVEVHDVKLKIKDDNGTHLAENCTPDAAGWKQWPLVLGAAEALSLTYSILPLAAFNEQQVGDLEIVWNRATDSGKTEEKIVCAIPLWQVSSEEFGVDVSMLGVSDHITKLHEFFVTYGLRNTTAQTVEVKVVMEESPHFFVVGEVSTKITLPPYESDELKFGMIPLRGGKFDLPTIAISKVVAGAVADPVLDRQFSRSVYVFPSS